MIDDWHGKMTVEVDMDSVFGELVDYFNDSSANELYFSHHGTNYALSIRDRSEPAPIDDVIRALDRIEKLSHTDQVNRICEALKNEWRKRGI